jgi:hypothetical protein
MEGYGRAINSLEVHDELYFFLKDPAIAGISLISRGKALHVPTRTCNCMACHAENKRTAKINRKTSLERGRSPQGGLNMSFLMAFTLMKAHSLAVSRSDDTIRDLEELLLQKILSLRSDQMPQQTSMNKDLIPCLRGGGWPRQSCSKHRAAPCVQPKFHAPGGWS